MATIETARDDIQSLFLTEWQADPFTADINVVYWDVPNSAPQTDENDLPLPWARVSVQNVASSQGSLSGDTGLRRWTRRGIVSVQLFAPKDTGLSIADKMGMVAMRAFEGRTTSSGIWFRDVSLQEVGPDSMWFQSNVYANFEYDEVR